MATASTLPLLPLPTRAEMERAYQGSDASYDGVFVLGVRTTGVFCRPSCGARKPKPENVEFFAQPKEALFAGWAALGALTTALSTDRIAAWLAKRRALLADGRSGLRIGHVDIFAQPIGRR